MDLDIIIRLHNDLTKLNPNQPSIVQYSPDTGLVYRQMGIVLALPYIGHMYFPTPMLKLGVLTPSGYHELMQGLQKLIQEPDLKKHTLSQVIKSYGLDVYKTYDKVALYGPQLLVSLRFVNFTNKLISSWILNWYGPETKTLLKAIQNETNKNKSHK